MPALIAVGCVAISQGAQTSTNVITGTLEKIDSGVKTIAVKTADGAVETMKFTDKTTVPERELISPARKAAR